MTGKTIQGDALLEQMPQVLDWLEGLGISARNSRYSRYVKHIDAFFASGEPLSEEGRRRFDAHTLAYRECVDINLVRKAFANETHKGFIGSLRKIVSGQDVPELKDAGVSRNYLFELLVAVRFAAIGYQIDFDFVTDVVAKKDGNVVYAECKRISSEKKLEANIKDAAEQLSEAMRYIPDRPSGIVFIDVSSCVEADVPKEVPQAYDVQPATKVGLARFFNRNGDLIERLNERFINTSLATCFIVQLPVWTPDGVLYTTATTGVVAARSLPDDRFAHLHLLLHRFDEAFNSYFA